MASTPTHDTSPLSLLPNEILLQITTHFDARTRSRLRSTSRGFHTLIPPFTFAQLRKIEKEYCYFVHYVCKHCLVLLPHSKFADNMVVDFRKRKLLDESGNRFCADCGWKVKHGGYPKGMYVLIQGKGWIKCKKCGEVSECERENDWALTQYKMKMCRGCHGEYKISQE